MKYLMCSFSLILFLIGCSKATDAIIPTDAAKWETELAPKIQSLSDTDKQLLGAYLARAKLGELFGGKGLPLGITVGSAIDDQKIWTAQRIAQEAKEAELKASLTKAQAETAALIDQVVTVTLVSKEQLPSDPHANRFSAEQVFKIGVKNTGSKVISGVAGALIFIDIFDKQVGEVTFRITETIQPLGGTIWTGTRDYNQFIAEQKALWNLEEGKYKTRFKPSMIVFADGSKLGSGS